MARKVRLDFEPNEYQERIFDWIQHGSGNAVIEACAGSGKTTTCVASMKMIPKDEKCLFIAFNKSIADELNEKVRSRPNCTARTTHSLGLLMLKRNIGSDVEIDEYKYRNYLKANISSLTTAEGGKMSRKDVGKYIDRITSLIDYSRFNLAQSEREINDVAGKYSIPISFDECVVTRKCLEWGRENTSTIDYTDMIWLPVELSLKPIGLTYDWVFFDEVQDASICTTRLFLKCIKRGGRFVCVGDSHQSINMFAGSSEDAFTFVREYPNTTFFTLPISYRCPKKVVCLANTLVKEIEAREDAPDGIISRNCHVSDIREGDMVLCRSKAPLVSLYVKLLRKNINCHIKGQDIGQNLIRMLDGVSLSNLGRELEGDGVFARLYDSMFTERNRLMQTRCLDYEDATLSSYIMDMYDAINTLLVLSERISTKDELIRHISSVFSDDTKGVCLSTVHKAKGLEADNVYILCNSSMPSKLAVKDWEVQQELNIMYVAYTRARYRLGFVSESEIRATGSMQEPSDILTEMAYFERKVCSILGKEPMEIMESAELKRFKVKNMKEIGDLHEGDNSVTLDEPVPAYSEDDILSDLEAF